MSARVQEAAFDFQAEVTAFQSAVTRSGAVVSFTGVVRDDTGSLDYMFIEHYPGMTEAQIKIIIEDSFKRWKINDALVIHRYGKLEPGEPIMMVATAAQHRKEAFEAAEFLMDYLKSRAPFWKKEVVNGKEHWVEAIATDENALSRWK